MVLDHVSQRSHAVVEAASALDAERLREGDLHRFDVVPVPDGFEDLVGEAQVHDVLDRLLPQEVIDAVDPVLVHHLEEPLVQRAGGGEVVPERLLDHDASPLGETGAAEHLHDRSEQRRRGGEVEDRPLRGAEGIASRSPEEGSVASEAM